MSASFGGDASSSSRVPLAAYAAADADADAAAHSFTETQMDEYREQDRYLPIANVSRIMKDCLPSSAKIAKESKECLQECVSEFISFITSEASERCLNEKRKTMNGEDILDAMTSLGFDNYVESLKPYLAKYRMSQSEKPRRSSKSGKSQNGGGTKGSAAGGVGAGGSKKVGSGGPGLGGEVDEDDEGEEGLYDDEEDEDEEDEEDEADAEDGSERWEKRARVG